jgi:hypothetical protein
MIYSDSAMTITVIMGIISIVAMTIARAILNTLATKIPTATGPVNQNHECCL